MFRSASLFIGTSFTVAVFAIFATSNVDSNVGVLRKRYSMQRILIHIKSRSLCQMCLSAPRVCSEPGGQKPVLSLSLDLIVFEIFRNGFFFSDTTRFPWRRFSSQNSSFGLAESNTFPDSFSYHRDSACYSIAICFTRSNRDRQQC